MKILWISPITGPDQARLDHLKDLLKKYAFPGTEVAIRQVARGTESIESRLDEVYALRRPSWMKFKEGKRKALTPALSAAPGTPASPWPRMWPESRLSVPWKPRFRWPRSSGEGSFSYGLCRRESAPWRTGWPGFCPGPIFPSTRPISPF